MLNDAPDLRSREFSFGREDFDALRALVKAHTGIHLSEQKRELVYGRISRRLRALGLASFREYRELLGSPGSAELGEFCNAITTNLTSFFRESHHFDYLRQHLLAPRAADRTASRRMRFWSAGCSTGEEPYSLAMTLHEALPDLPSWDIRILATDLDTDVLAKGQRGIYAEDRLRGLHAPLRAKYFLERDREAPGSYAVADSLRRMICFRSLNLVRELPMKGPFDAIFCRNVIIYFDKDTQRELFARMARLQPPGALLFLGHSETLFRVSEAYSLVGKT
ncbi:MAG TPA: protein-glutamate O-methyltransferase CheR, partial [Steroidobacteraceae bacterium]|nr:protein-glutamate O-methyltransferase CheR [Steroidobacteraceae bacterium]